MDESAERFARNQLLFREVNERLREIADPSTAVTEFLCECSDLECRKTIELDLSDYEAIRSTPNAFLVVAGHESFERVVEGAQDRFMRGAPTKGMIDHDSEGRASH